MNFIFWTKLVASTIVLLIVMMILPYDRYIKYQSIQTGVYKKSKWLYERANFDETPVDVAFFGTSHTLLSMDSESIQNGLSEKLKKEVNVVNYAIPQLGRDMHYTLLKMLLSSKKPDLVILEVHQSEARDMHPGTHYLAETVDLIKAPLIVNLRYFDNLYRIPGRNLKLSIISIWPELFSYQSEFDKNNYKGKHFFKSIEQFSDSRGSNRTQTREWLDNARAVRRGNAPYYYQDVDKLSNYIFFNASNIYVSRIAKLLEERGIALKFVYLPHYNTQTLPFRDIYSDKADLINFGANFYTRDDVWADLVHLNYLGATHTSNVVQQEIYEFYRQDDRP